MQPVALPDEDQGVVAAALRPGGGTVVAIVGGTRLLRFDEDGHSPADLVPRLAGAQPGDVQTYLSVTWAGADRVLVRQTAPAGIFFVDLSGQSRTPLPLNGLDPAPSPDGSHLAFASAGDRPYFSIFVAGEPFENPSKLTADDVGEATPAWSPDATWIAYSAQVTLPSGQTSAWEVRIVRLDGTQEQTLIPARPGIAYSSLAWSPDGTHISYTRYEEGVHRRQIGVVKRDGSDAMAISDEDANDRVLEWVN